MSGIVKKIGRVFKKAIKTVKKIAPYALAAAAVVFTGGAALGVGLPSFAGAMGSLVSSAGLSGALGTAVTGALTNAGFGAAVGGVLGGKSGLKTGALMGAVTGGLMGPIGGTGMTSAQAGGLQGALDTAGANVANISTGLPGAISANTGLVAPASGGLMGAISGAAPAASSIGTIAGTAASGVAAGGGGGLLGNPLVTSQVLQGLGQGLMGRAAAREAREAEQRQQANYDTSGGTFGSAVTTPNNPYAQTASTRWVYDPARRGLVQV